MIVYEMTNDNDGGVLERIESSKPNQDLKMIISTQKEANRRKRSLYLLKDGYRLVRLAPML